MFWLVSFLLFLCGLACLPLTLLSGRGGAVWELLPAFIGLWLARYLEDAATSSWSLLLLVGVAGIAIDYAFPAAKDERRLGASKGGLAGAAIGMLVAVIFSGPWLWPVVLPLAAGIGEVWDRQHQGGERIELTGSLLTLCTSGVLMMLTITPWT